MTADPEKNAINIWFAIKDVVGFDAGTVSLARRLKS
jgi:hypothetical protein